MCIFSIGDAEVGNASPVSVHNTRIFARMSGHGTQYLAYSMSYAANAEVAMILPLPVATRDEETAVRFLSLQDYPDFFDDIYRLFPAYPGYNDGTTLCLSDEAERPALVVHQVGDFEASFVPTLADFDRLDKRFTLPPSVWEQLPQYHDYGFAVFKLRVPRSQEALEVHPMAFEFVTRSPDALYFPTVHVHDGQVHSADRFDHLLFCQAEQVTMPTKRIFYDGKHLSLLDFHDVVMQKGETLDTGLSGAKKWAQSAVSAACGVQVIKTQNLVHAGQKCHLLMLNGLLPNEDTWLPCR